MNMKLFCKLVFAGMLAQVAGCRCPGFSGSQPASHRPSCDSLCSVEVQYGNRRPVVDAVGWVTGIPSKVLLWDRRACNHSVSDQTVDEVANYLQHRQLDDTLVRVNQYAPLDELERLVKNQSISPGWKYTVGSVKWLKYTFVPGRLFGKDEYNPYTNSLSLYSDMPTLGLAEAAYAKDVSSRELPGTYSAVQEIPIVSLWHESLATSEVINYVAIHGTSEQIDKVRHDLYARFGIETAGAVSSVLPDGTGLFAILGAAGGHAVAAIDDKSDSVRR